MGSYKRNNYEDRVSRQSFILDCDCLKRLYDLGVGWISDGDGEKICLCEAHCKQTNDVISSSSIEPILQYSNNKQNQIYVISMIMKSGEDTAFRLRIQTDPDWPTLLFEVYSDDEEKTEKIYQIVNAELKETVQWYSFLSNRVKVHLIVSKYNWLWITICMLLFLYSLVSVVFNHYNRQEVANQHLLTLLENKQEISRLSSITLTEGQQQELSERDEQLDEQIAIFRGILGQKYLSTVLAILIFGVLSFFGGYFGNKVLLYLFPRGTILIGSEIKRHDALAKLRTRVIWGACWTTICTIIGTIIAGIIMAHCGII